MTIWSIQTIEAFDILNKNGFFRASENVCDDSFLSSYLWMSDQMIQRGIAKPENARFPLWGWFQFENSDKAMPDLRKKGFMAAQDQGVRIQLDIPDSSVLLSDFDLWHYVFDESIYS